MNTPDVVLLCSIIGLVCLFAGWMFGGLNMHYYHLRRLNKQYDAVQAEIKRASKIPPGTGAWRKAQYKKDGIEFGLDAEYAKGIMICIEDVKK